MRSYTYCTEAVWPHTVYSLCSRACRRAFALLTFAIRRQSRPFGFGHELLGLFCSLPHLLFLSSPPVDHARLLSSPLFLYFLSFIRSYFLSFSPETEVGAASPPAGNHRRPEVASAEPPAEGPFPLYGDHSRYADSPRIGPAGTYG